MKNSMQTKQHLRARIAQLEHALTECQQVEEKFHLATLETALDGFWLVEASTQRIIQVNEAYCRMSGYSRAELLEMTIPQLEDRESSREVETHIHKVLHQGGERFETRHRRKDGSVFHLEVSVQPAPEIGKLFAFLRDITERTRAADALRLEKERFEILSAHAPFAMMLIRADGTFAYINPQFSKVFGYDLDDVPNGKAWFTRAFPDAEYRRVVIAAWTDDLLAHAHAEPRPRTFTVTCQDRTEKLIHFIPVQLNNNEHLVVCEDITERARAAEKLRERERATATLLSNLPGIVYRCKNDPDWTMEFVSEGCLALTGYAPTDLIGNSKITYAQIIHPNDRAAIWDQVQACLQERRPFQITYRIRAADGAEKYVWEQGRGIFAADGALLALEGFITDITERMRAEQSARESERRYRELFENANDIIYTHDLAGNFTSINRAAEQASGYTREQALALNIRQIVAPEYLEPIRQVLAPDALGKGPLIHELEIIARDGRRVPLELSTRLIFREHQPIGVQGIARDITERKRTEQVVLGERNLLRTVIDNIPDRVFAKDLEGRYVIVNRADAHALDVTDPTSVIGKNDFEFYASDAAVAFRDEDQAVIISGKPFHYEGSYQDKSGNGSWRWLKLTKVPWQNAEGQVIGIVGIGSDITAYKEIEQQLNRANEKLMIQIDQLHELQAQLREQAIRDPLTQLFNRHYVNETMPREIARALRQSTTLGFVMIDLDHFKQINDTYGHAAGDQALQTIARVTQTQLRASDIVCRYGGEEILCLLPDTTEEIVHRRAEQLCATIAEAVILQQHPQVRLTASVGVAVLPPDGTDMIGVLQAADAALYQAKADGRNCVRIAREGKN